jgi:hypothetical protein
MCVVRALLGELGQNPATCKQPVGRGDGLGPVGRAGRCDRCEDGGLEREAFAELERLGEFVGAARVVAEALEVQDEHGRRVPYQVLPLGAHGRLALLHLDAVDPLGAAESRDGVLEADDARALDVYLEAPEVLDRDRRLVLLGAGRAAAALEPALEPTTENASDGRGVARLRLGNRGRRQRPRHEELLVHLVEQEAEPLLRVLLRARRAAA